MSLFDAEALTAALRYTVSMETALQAYQHERRARASISAAPPCSKQHNDVDFSFARYCSGSSISGTENITGVPLLKAFPTATACRGLRRVRDATKSCPM